MKHSPFFPSEVANLIDLRSDTVTRPSAEMVQAMIAAPLGDDVLGDEPTVARLESKVIEMTGMEAAVFVPSGTMGNQIALACHTQRGDTLIAGANAHIFFYECGGPAVLAQVLAITLNDENGYMDPDQIDKSVRKQSLHTPGTTLLAIEHTHNRAGGALVPDDHLAAYRTLASRHNIKLHMDGARLPNAASTQGKSMQEILTGFDSVSICLSKGLGAPVGSVLAGKADFIERARLWRKRLGGGLRQSGILAACGLYALEHNFLKLADDTKRAKRFASELQNHPGIKIDLDRVHTNIVMMHTDAPASAWVDRMEEKGVRALAFDANRIRFVFHLDVDDAAVDRAVAEIKTIQNLA